MSNLIQIKRSQSTDKPTSLANGELAWSSNSEILWIGDFNTVYAVGGPGQIEVSSELTKTVAANGVVTIGLAGTVDFTDLEVDSLTAANTITLSGYTVDGFIDDDSMASASNTTLATSESIKQYVDDEIAGVVAGAASDLDDLGDVTITTPVQGQVLGYSGTEWIDYNVIGETNVINVSANSTALLIDLEDVAGLTTGAQGNATHVATFSVDAQGRLTAAGNTAIAIPSSALTTDVALGTQTTGNYVEDITGDTTIVVTGGPSEGATPALSLVSGQGLDQDATGVFVGFGDGITGNSTAVEVQNANSTISVGASGIAVNESALTIATSQLTGDVALGTNTSGDYVQSITEGNGIASTGASSGESVDHTLSVVAANGISVTADGVNVVGAAGLVSNTTGVHVGQGDGITVNADDVAVNDQDGLVANSSGLFVVTGNGLQINSGSGVVEFAPGSNITVGDLAVEGDLTVTGNVVSLQITEFDVEDPLIHLASNNVADSLDIGFVAHYSKDAGVTSLHAGLYRDVDDEKFHFFKDLEDANLDNGATTIDQNGTGYARADIVVAGIDASGTIAADTLTLTANLEVQYGGTGRDTFTDNGIVYGNGTGALSVTAAATAQQITDGAVLTVSGSGVPEWGSLDGGTF